MFSSYLWWWSWKGNRLHSVTKSMTKCKAYRLAHYVRTRGWKICKRWNRPSKRSTINFWHGTFGNGCLTAYIKMTNGPESDLHCRIGAGGIHSKPELGVKPRSQTAKLGDWHNNCYPNCHVTVSRWYSHLCSSFDHPSTKTQTLHCWGLIQAYKVLIAAFRCQLMVKSMRECFYYR